MFLRVFRGFIKFVFEYLPLGNYIMLESRPDFSDNTKCVFDELQRRGLNNKYKFVWWVTDREAYSKKYPDLIFVDKLTPFNKIVFMWYKLRAKTLISSNLFLGSVLKKQKSFFLTHGTGIKKIGSYNCPNTVDYVLTASSNMNEMMARELCCDINKIFSFGLPRNDAFNKDKRDLRPILGKNFSKVIVWLPTFRQHKSGKKTGSAYALPVIHSVDSAKQINEWAKENNILIVVKPHFAQDLRYLEKENLDNIIFIDESVFEANNISLNEFLNSSDALITDYSGVYFDYLLNKKPIAVVWEDINDYRINPGFAVDVDFYMKPTHKIYNVEDFESFITAITNGEDCYAEEREFISSIVNYSDDGKNTERVVDFIVEKAGLI